MPGVIPQLVAVSMHLGHRSLEVAPSAHIEAGGCQPREGLDAADRAGDVQEDLGG
jgi:hypothetical protein